MSLNVLYLPGLLGSCLSIDRGAGAPPDLVWPSGQAAVDGGLRYLQLAPDGVSPGPLAQGATILPSGLLGPIYAPLFYFMQALGWNVVAVPYDWRLSVLTSAQAVLNAALLAFGSQPFYIVAHSQGGLVARCVWNLMVAEGRDSQLLRIVTLCTPQFGALEAVRLWWHMPVFYQALVALQGWQAWIPGTPGPAYLDTVVATLPCFYELACFRDYGPLFTAAPSQAASIYQASSYAGANPALLQAPFDAAGLVQDTLNGVFPAGRMVEVIGLGSVTPYQFTGLSAPTTEADYLYTTEGDGLVTQAQASLPGVPFATVTGSHSLVPLLPNVWAFLASAVPNGLSGSITLS
jgi:hypothetical protein